MASETETYNRIKESLAWFLDDNKLDSAACLNLLDDIILGYVAGILADLNNEDSADGFDVDDFIEMISAYCPSFANISHERIFSWIHELAKQLKALNGDVEPRKETLSLLALSSSLPCASSLENEACARRQRVSNWSETSEGSMSSDDTSTSSQSQGNDEDVTALKELFPTVSGAEIKHCLNLASGDVQEAVQWILQRQESGEAIKGIPARKKDVPLHDDESLKKLIINKYSYVDQDEDKKEHRPPPPKFEPKKLVRYRENQVVTIKGEKYTEVKSKEADDMKKTYVNLKPARQYRFH